MTIEKKPASKKRNKSVNFNSYYCSKSVRSRSAGKKKLSTIRDNRVSGARAARMSEIDLIGNPELKLGHASPVVALNQRTGDE